MSLTHIHHAVIVAATAAGIALVASQSLVLAAPQAPPAQEAPITQPGHPAPPAQIHIGEPPHSHPAPTNLKVLPRNLTGEQVHDIMHQWAGELGTSCKTCHAFDKVKKTPDGKPALNYADDSKEEKRTARTMVKMVDQINANYIAKIDSSGSPVTCGTCHRGHLGPETFVPAPPPPPGQ